MFLCSFLLCSGRCSSFWLSPSFIRLTTFHINMYAMAGCFSILPATELVPGDIVEVAGMCALSPKRSFVAMAQSFAKLLMSAFRDACMRNSGL